MDASRACRSIRSFTSSSSVRPPSLPSPSVEGPLLLLMLLLLAPIIEGVVGCEDEEEAGESPPSKADIRISMSRTESSTASSSKKVPAAEVKGLEEEKEEREEER